MNERIKELLVEAREQTKEGKWNAPTGVWAEKFAKLLVRECMEQVWYTREDSINGNISEVIKERMTQHFGIEE